MSDRPPLVAPSREGNLPSVLARFRGKSWFERLLTLYEQKVRERSLVGQFVRKFRRLYLGVFRKDYVAQSIAANRQGDCHRCGLCCQLIYKCTFLGKDGQGLPYCRIYGDLRPTNCRTYPFDSIDSEVDRCGFKFESEQAVLEKLKSGATPSSKKGD
jgi:hypothetical protein